MLHESSAERDSLITEEASKHFMNSVMKSWHSRRMFGMVILSSTLMAISLIAGAVAQNGGKIILTGTVNGPSSGGTFTVRVPNGSIYRIRARRKPSFALRAGDVVRVYGIRQNGTVYADNLRLVQRRMKNQDQKDDSRTQPETDMLTVTLKTDKSTYGRGETVNFTITARNTGATPRVLNFSSGQNFDITATPRDGEEEQNDTEPVWRWSRGRMFTRMLRRITLAPGEEMNWTATWEQTTNNGDAAPRGEYTMRATLTAAERIESKSVVLTLAD